MKKNFKIIDKSHEEVPRNTVRIIISNKKCNGITVDVAYGGVIGKKIQKLFYDCGIWKYVLAKLERKANEN